MMHRISNSPKAIKSNLTRLHSFPHRSRHHCEWICEKSLLSLKREGYAEYLQQIGKSKMEYSEQFHPQSCSEGSEQRYGRPKQQQRYVSGEKNGKWSEKQNTQYIVYIQLHKEKMRSKEKRRVSKLYKEMARFIGTRNALQCRSHHQKLEDRYLYPNKIIANYKQHNDLALYMAVKLELEEYERKIAEADLPHLKLQEENMENPTMADLRPIQPNSNPTSQDGSGSEVQSDPAVSVWTANPAPIISYDLAQIANNWSTFFYFPAYQIN